jgi:predicted Zn-dependent peptidase
MVLALALAAALAAPDTLDTPTALRNAPAAVIVHHQPAIPIVALRISLQVDDPPGYAGAGHLFQRLVFPRLQDQVARVGGRAQMQRNSDAIVYTVIGPAMEIDFLATTLRSALQVPSVSSGEMAVALHRLEEARLAEWETAARHVRSSLRQQLFPADLPAPGTPAAAERFDLSVLRPLWGTLYRPDRVTVVAVGDIGIAEVRRAFADLPAPPRERLRDAYSDTLPLQALAPAEATRGWLGLAYEASPLDPAALTVAARLLSESLRRRLPTSEVRAEHWWTHHGQALAVVVASPEAQLPAARRALGTALTTLQQEVTELQVYDAATALRREMLHISRTPERMADVVGSFADRTGDPNASQRFYTDLRGVTRDDIERVLGALTGFTPARVDIPPQPLDRR